MTGLADGRKKNRPQGICTPQPIVDVVYEVWPQGIALDPCHHAESIVSADRVYDFSKGQNGLIQPWSSRTFINPPYDDLKRWFKKGRSEFGAQIWLVPNRTNRLWFREWRSSQSAFVELDPVKFLGYDNAAPFALILTYFGVDSDSFVAAAIGLGQVWKREGSVWRPL